MREQEVKLFSLNQSHLALKVMLLQSQDPWILLLTLHLGVERELQYLQSGKLLELHLDRQQFLYRDLQQLFLYRLWQ